MSTLEIFKLAVNFNAINVMTAVPVLVLGKRTPQFAAVLL